MPLTDRVSREAISRVFPVAAATAALLLFSVGEFFRYFLALLAVVGLVLMVMEHRQPKGRWFHWYAALFACIWIPILASAVDAESMESAITTSARYLIYLFAGYLWITRFSSAGKPRPLLAGAFAILLFWSLDGVFQLMTGVNFFGNEVYGQGRLTGMFGPRLGFVLAIFAPVFFHAVRTFGERIPMLWLTLLPYLVVILYGGSRVSWMLLLIGVISYLGLLRATRVKLRSGAITVRLLLISAVCIIAVLQTDWLKTRVTALSGLASGDYETLNYSVANRLSHWQTSIRMYRENPVNGIGVKGFRDAYLRYSQGDDTRRGQPHMFLLEVAAETGSIGLIGYLAFFVLILGKLRSLWRQQRFEAIPWGITLILAAFPLSATLSLYSHFMSALVWYIAMLFFGVAAYEERVASPIPGCAAPRQVHEGR